MGARGDIADQVLLLWLHRTFREGSYLAQASSFMQDSGHSCSLDHHGATWLASVKGGLYFPYHSGCCHACINTVFCPQQVISLIFTSQISNKAHYQVRAGEPHSVHS